MNSGTIFAPASGGAPAAIAVIRISGPDAGAAVRALAGALPAARRARLCVLRDPGGGETLDRGVVLWFPGPASFTGEDMAELHLHGGRAVVGAVTDALAGVPGLRAAEPGEFTRRAFENGKLDLTEAEGVADLVDAETAAQRRQALRQLEGALGRLYEGWRSRLVEALARLEADIDFGEEELDEGIGAAVKHNILGIRSEITQHLDDDRRGERLRDGIYIAVLGPPNAGKSSLVNALARRDAAIVSAMAGTTRDVIEVHLDLGGYPVIVADTAGLRAVGGQGTVRGAGQEAARGDAQESAQGDAVASEDVEAEGVRRALARAAAADLKIAMVEAPRWPELGPELAAVIDADTLVVVNKIDLCRPEPPPVGPAGPASGPAGPGGEAAGGPAATVAVSVKTGEGMPALVEALESAVGARLAGPAGAPALTRARHRAALEECRDALARYEGAALPELAAEDVRLAARALGRITGRVDVEDILDVIFRDFCIGK